MAKFRSAVERSRKARAFANGFVTGLAAPAFLLAGSLDGPVSIRRSSMQDSINSAGGYLRAGVTAFRRTAAKRAEQT